MKKSIVIAIVGVLVVAGVGSAVYFQTMKKPSVGSAVASTEQEAAVPFAEDMEAQVKEVVAAKEAELEAKKAAEQAAKEEAEKAAKEKEQVANNNTGNGNTTAKSNKSGGTGTKSNGSASSNGNSNNESNSTSAVTDDDNPIPGLTPGQSWDMGEPIHESEIPGGGTAYSYDPIVIPPTE